MPTPEFIEVANEMLDEIMLEMAPPEMYVASHIQFWAKDEPSLRDYQATNTVPGNDILLGMYIDEPVPSITIYEESINRALPLWDDYKTAVKAVLSHEIWQHGMGLDHTRETLMNGWFPAFSLPHDVQWCGCHAIS